VRSIQFKTAFNFSGKNSINFKKSGLCRNFITFSCTFYFHNSKEITTCINVLCNKENTGSQQDTCNIWFQDPDRTNLITNHSSKNTVLWHMTQCSLLPFFQSSLQPSSPSYIKTKTSSSSKMLVHIYQTTQRCIPQTAVFNSHYYDSLNLIPLIHYITVLASKSDRYKLLNHVLQ